MARHMGLVDLNTGVIEEEGFIGFQKPRSPHPYGNRWFAMSQDGMKIIKQMRRVDDMRVAAHLFDILDYNNELFAPVKQTAEELNMRPQNVSAAMRRLVEANVIAEGEKQGSNKRYRLLPSMGWKGRSRDFPKKEMAGSDYVGLNAKRKGLRSPLAQTDKQSQHTAEPTQPNPHTEREGQ